MTSHILSTSDCEQILERKCGTRDFKILRSSIAPFSDSFNGFMGEHLRAKFTILLHGEQRVVQCFVKRQPDNDNTSQNQFIVETDVYMKEAFLYEQVIGTGNQVSWAPPFYLSKNNNTLVMDDVSVDGFVLPVFIQEQFDLTHCRFVLSTLAAFHAHCLELEHRKSLEMGRPYFFGDEFPDKFKAVLFLKTGTLSAQWVKTSIASVEHFIDVIPESNCLSPEAFKVKVRNLFEQIYEGIKPAKKFRNVICHGDLWFKNMLFRYVDGQPEQCLLIDFQLVRYCVPTHDIAMFLQMNTSRSFRKQHMETLLRFYHNKLGNELQQHGMDVEDVLPWEDLDASFPEQIRIIKLITFLYKSCHFLGSDVFEQLKIPEVYHEIMFGNRHTILLEQYKNNPVYRSKIIELMTELREVLMEPNILREDCYKILHKKLNGDNFELEQFSTTAASSRQIGYLGDHKILNMSLLHNGERKHLNFFMKLTPSAADQLTFVMHSGGFTKEIFLYDVLYEKMKEMGVTQISEVTPMHYMTRKNDCLIFDNLMHEGYKSLDKCKKLTYTEVCKIIGVIAKYHSASLIFEEKMSVKRGKKFRIGDEYAKYCKEPYYVDYEDKMMNSLLETATNGLLLEVELLLDPTVVDFEEMRHKITLISKKFATFMKPSTKYRNVISHGDLYASNIMVQRDIDGELVRPILIDFQTCRYLSPANDLMCFLYFNTTPSFRDQYEHTILSKYHSLMCDELLSHGLDADEIIPFADFRESCEYNRLFAATQAAMFDQIILMNDDFFAEQLQHADPHEHAQIFVGDRSYLITENCKINERYESMLKQSITTLCDLCKTLDPSQI